MKRKRFSVEQIVEVLKQAEIGVPVVTSQPSVHEMFWNSWSAYPAEFCVRTKYLCGDRSGNWYAPVWAVIACCTGEPRLS